MHGGILHWQRQGVASWKAGLAPQYSLLWFCNTAPMLRLLPHAGNEEVLRDGHWLGLLLATRLLLALRHLRRDWYGWHGSMGFLGVHSLCLSALLGWRWQMLVLLDLAHICQGRHPLLPFALHLRPAGGTVDSGSGSCATE